MTDRPILFSAPMVRAIIREIEQPGSGKTQTRLVLMTTRNGTPAEMHPSGRDAPFNDPEQWGFPYYDRSTDCTDIMFLPDYAKRLYALGDRLWVRESLERANGEAVGYPADGSWLPNTPWDFKRASVPSIHMPRWASRLTLIVTDVRVQRLQAISEADAIAEGIAVGKPLPEMPFSYGDIYHDGVSDPIDGWTRDPVEAFTNLWDGINAKRDDGAFVWSANPWVAALTFRAIKQNIDQEQAA